MTTARKLKRIASIAVSILLSAVAAVILTIYTRPLETIEVHDLTLGWEGEIIPADWTYDAKGWSIFTQEHSTSHPLTPDGRGGFTGLDYPGQTCYFSRVMEEDAQNPILWLGPSSSSLAVFLDGELLYTDCPEADNRIGWLTLCIPERQRTEPVAITLPAGYLGKTLTIAQGGTEEGEDVYVQPAPVVLSNGYAYESELIAESFQIAIPAVVLLLMEAALLALFCWQVFHGRGDIGLVCAATAAVLWMTSLMALASFAYTYFGDLTSDVVLFCRDLSRGALLAFLASRSTEGRRVVLGVFTGISTTQAVISILFELTGLYPLYDQMEVLRPMEALGLLSLLAALVLGYVERRRNRGMFYGIFVWLTVAGIAGCAAVTCMVPQLRRSMLVQLSHGAVLPILQPLTFLMMAAAILAAVVVAIRRELERRMESRLLAQRQNLAQASYEAMRIHQEQVMMLRHDMVKHLHLLRQMTGEAQVAAYLGELIGENEKIRPVIQSGNEMLDIILNSKITAAADAGIYVEVVRSQAPETLPLSEMEQCSLFMNLMDNAVAGAQASGAKNPYIRLDLHVKSGFFVFSCKNSAVREGKAQAKSPDGIPKHGLGLKIIRHVSQRYGDLMETEWGTEWGTDFYKVMVAIPLPGEDRESQPSK